ncbi:unnamed protein product [Ceutorhynchus assimilis]|uniref:Helitron helicase-like domain-containing protein n=1 Tax=Ceutorhynchus assimilis TaxID=467358 RepID=A0A9N9QI29_9CUCU|nr:unnamed protein product [Ceutorhynchus assimilis]
MKHTFSTLPIYSNNSCKNRSGTVALHLRLNQKKLRTAEYIHLPDEIINDENIDDIGTMVISPSSYIGSPRHMHEYTQDAMTYVRKYGRLDLFIIIFTCNSSWPEIKEQLKYGQVAMDQHERFVLVHVENRFGAVHTGAESFLRFDFSRISSEFLIRCFGFCSTQFGTVLNHSDGPPVSRDCLRIKQFAHA